MVTKESAAKLRLNPLFFISNFYDVLIRNKAPFVAGKTTSHSLLWGERERESARAHAWGREREKE